LETACPYQNSHIGYVMMRATFSDRIVVLYVDAAYCYRPTIMICRSVAVVSHAKTAEPIEMPVRIGTQVDPRKHGGAHWRHLLNTIKPSMCSGDAAFCQITLTVCFFLVLLIKFMYSANLESIKCDKWVITPTHRNVLRRFLKESNHMSTERS